MKKYTITYRVTDRGVRFQKTERNEQIVDDYIKNDMSMREIAEKYDITVARVSKIIQKYG